jgi:hypothetical protein
VLAIVGAGAGAATVILLHQKNSGQSQTGSTQGSTGALPPASLQIVDAVNKPASGALPAGFTLHSHQASSAEKAGFRIAAPSNWTASTSGHQTYLKSPSGNVQVLVDLTPHTYPNDMVAEARYIRAQALAEHHFPGYRDIQVAATPVRGTHGAFWKFTWLNDGVRQEVLDLLFTMQTPAGPQSYALYFTSPASAWDQTHPVFDEAAETFAPQA